MRRFTPLIAAFVLVACSIGPATSTSAKNPSPSPSASPTATPSYPACALPSQVAPRPASGVSSNLTVWNVLDGLNQPDDLLFHDGSLYVGELGAGKIHVLTAGKANQVLPFTIPKVEGMAFINGTLYVADQQDDRVDVVHGSSVQTLLQLSPVAGQDGVDNIVAVGNQLIVPDSPRGVVDWVDTNGHITKTVSGFVRPTGAWPLADGSILIADEFGNAAIRLAPDSSRTYVARGVPILDDIASDSRGNVFVATPVAGAGRLAQLVNGGAVNAMSGLLAPQGIAFDAADNVYVSESDRGRVDFGLRTFKILPFALGGGDSRPRCVPLARAGGFHGSITLSGDPRLTITQQPGTNGNGGVVANGCTQSDPCRLTATSDSLRDDFFVASRP